MVFRCGASACMPMWLEVSGFTEELAEADEKKEGLHESACAVPAAICGADMHLRSCATRVVVVGSCTGTGMVCMSVVPQGTVSAKELSCITFQRAFSLCRCEAEFTRCKQVKL